MKDMFAANMDAANEIQSFEDLIRFLQRELDWPIGSLEFEDLVFDYSPEEFGFSNRDHSPLGRIMQFRAPAERWHWGIFFIEFKRKFSVSTLRRLLRSLVVKRRHSAARADRAAWMLEDLLFITSHPEGSGTVLTISHFFQSAESSSRSRLASFGWTPGGRNRTLLEHNLPCLRWPVNPSNADTWRTEWLSAFDKERLTRDFYRDFKTIFDQVVVDISGEEADPKALVLMSRILFLYFVQKKGWLEGKPDYLVHAFEPYRAAPNRKPSIPNSSANCLMPWPTRERIATPTRCRRFRTFPFSMVVSLNPTR